MPKHWGNTTRPMPLYKYLGDNLVNEMPFPLGNMMNGGAQIMRTKSLTKFLILILFSTINSSFSLISAITKHSLNKTIIMVKTIAENTEEPQK